VSAVWTLLSFGLGAVGDVFLQGALNAVFEQARKINVNVPVEGIESMEQLTMLRRCGCSEGQGFYLSRPIPVEEFEKQISGEGKQ